MALGGEIVIMPKPDLGAFLELVERAPRHPHVPAADADLHAARPSEALDATDLSSLQCFWYGAAPMSADPAGGGDDRIGPVMAQLFGQTEAPMMISMLPPADHFHAGRVASPRERLASAGRPAPLVTVAIMDADGRAAAVRRARRDRHPQLAGDGRLLQESRGDGGGLAASAGTTPATSATSTTTTSCSSSTALKDMIITGGFNVYSAEVEQALMEHPDVQDCAVIGLPDDKWGERVDRRGPAAAGRAASSADELTAFVKERIGSVKAPKQVEIWADLPRSKVGKVLKAEVRSELLPKP